MSLEEHLKSSQASESFRGLVSKLSEDDLLALEAVEAELAPSTNTLKDILELAWEVAVRDGLELSEVFKKSAVSEALAVDGGRKAKQRSLKDALEVLRFPKLAEIKSELDICVCELLAETGVRVQLPRDLEGDRLSVSISARNCQEFSAAARKLDDLSVHPKLARIFAILSGNI